MSMSYQEERDRFIATFAARCATAEAMTTAGPAVFLARALLRAATTLHRLAEAQCNGDWPYDNGERKTVPCGRCEAGCVPSKLIRYKAGPMAPKDQIKICPDCATQDRVKALLRGSGWVPHFQGDPRGAVLWIYPDDGEAGDRYTGNHPRAIAVPGRY